MTKENTESKELTKHDFLKLERSLHELTTALTQHIDYLGKHTSAMDNLTQAINQLDTTIKKEYKESQQPSLQLKEAVTTFVEYHINPRFYQDMGFLQLKAASPALKAELAKLPKHTNKQ